MSENIFSAALTFCLLVGGTAAIGSEMFRPAHAPAAQTRTEVVTLPMVTVIAHRAVDTKVVMLPEVTITGHRATATQVAFGAQASEPRHLQ